MSKIIDDESDCVGASRFSVCIWRKILLNKKAFVWAHFHFLYCLIFVWDLRLLLTLFVVCCFETLRLSFVSGSCCASLKSLRMKLWVNQNMYCKVHSFCSIVLPFSHHDGVFAMISKIDDESDCVGASRFSACIWRKILLNKKAFVWAITPFPKQLRTCIGVCHFRPGLTQYSFRVCFPVCFHYQVTIMRLRPSTSTRCVIALRYLSRLATFLRLESSVFLFLF